MRDSSDAASPSGPDASPEPTGSAALTSQQAEALHRTIGRQLRYLNRLCARMQALRWPLDDPVVIAAQAARNALQDLYTMTHYAACKHGVGRRSD